MNRKSNRFISCKSNLHVPTKKTCLKEIFKLRIKQHPYCRCGSRILKYYKLLKSRKEFRCSKCGQRISPLSGTPFHKTRVPLNKWFYVLKMYPLDSTTPKSLHYDIGVSYKTSLRMLTVIDEWKKLVKHKDGNLFDNLMQDLPPLFEGHLTN